MVNRFSTIKRLAFAMIFASMLSISATANESTVAGYAQEGTRLVRQIWTDMKESNIQALEKMMGAGFQSAHEDGKVRSKAEELKLIEGLKLSGYKLEHFKVSQEGPALIVSYTVQVEETIDRERLSKKPALRMSIFLKTKTGWKWIAHNNFKPIE